jgi:hypothetical protein
VYLFHPTRNGAARLLEGIGPGKPALLISSSCISKAAPRVAKPSQEHAGRDGYPERVGSSAANMTWYLGSSRTDFANRGSCISLLMPAIVALATLSCLPFFFILSY